MKSQKTTILVIRNLKINIIVGYADNGAYWRSWYEMDGFEAECDRLWNIVKPLYQNLHAYVKRKLMEKYEGKPFPASGHIPAHILGKISYRNMR